MSACPFCAEELPASDAVRCPTAHPAARDAYVAAEQRRREERRRR